MDHGPKSDCFCAAIQRSRQLIEQRLRLLQIGGIGDIPILGALFKSEQFRREETELIIIVTPYLVRPISDQKIPLPTDPFTREPASASGAQKVSTSQIVPVPIGASSATGQTSSAGYILD